jgi:hypothetical protein
MSWNQHGVFAQAPPGASGVPQVSPGQQVQPPSHEYSYGTDQLPPPPGQAPQGPPNPYGVQPGVPGAPMAQPYQTSQPGQQWGTPSQAQASQAPQGVPPLQVPQAPQAPQGQPGRVQMSDNSILDGPGVPPELRGRTWADARRLYQALSTDWLQRNGQQRAPVMQQPTPQTPSQAPQGTPQGGSDPRQFWANPDQRIAEVVQNTVGQMLQPVIQQTQSQAILQARQIASTGIRDFDYLEPDIMQIVAGANPQDLQNPQVWIAAARMARGQRMEAGQYDPRAAQQHAPQVPGQGPGMAVPAYQAPPVHQFFSESPSAPNVSQSAYGAARQPTQEDYQYAQKWQMPIQDFMAWKYGTGQQPVGSF